MHIDCVSARLRPPGWLRLAALILTAGCVLLAPAQASIYVQQLKLDKLCARADRIVRGTVINISRGEVQAGGATLNTITYRLRVKDTVVGKPVEIVDLTMVADPKTAVRSGNARREGLLELPELKEGKEYLLFTTKPSRLGLSSPVGLAQGSFSITTKGGKDFAVNGANNHGLGLAAAGPVEYQELVRKIKALRPN